MEKLLMGRRLLKKEIPAVYYKELNQKKVKTIKAMVITEKYAHCNRCGMNTKKSEAQIKIKKSSIYYCPECLILGRVESRLTLFFIKEKNNSPRKILFDWQGQLTKEQDKIANELITSFKNKKNHIVQAVTGAGKTEMLFPLLKEVLSKGCRVAIASPRVDVCLELFPRLTDVFPEEKIVLLYGEKEEPYEYSSFVLATTHQLIRFYQAFDLIVVDEVDAFPFANNKMLENAVKSALKKSGRLVYLTATPSKELKKEIAQNKLRTSDLPKRYHGHQLPEPKCRFDYFLIHTLQKNKLPKCLERILNKQNRQCLLFFSTIDRMEICFQLLKKKYPQKKIAYVYAGKPDRKESVLAMRHKKIDWLLSTTILERGVTFSDIDVLVFEADHRVFNTASLVQIAGRVGRKKDFPTGNVYFLHKGKTNAINQAISQINKMNKKAGFK